MAKTALVTKKVKKSGKAEAEAVVKKAKGFPAKKPLAKGEKAKPKAKKAKILFKAPEDFKPAFFEVDFATCRDGLVNGSSVQVNRVKGKWDNEEAKRYNLAEYDLATLLGITARLGSIFAPNVLKRLPPKTKFGLILRANRKSADGSLAVAVKEAKMAVEGKNGKMKMKWFSDKKDPIYRKLRRIKNVLPSAFINVQLPPSGRQKKAKADEE